MIYSSRVLQELSDDINKKSNILTYTSVIKLDIFVVIRFHNVP